MLKFFLVEPKWLKQPNDIMDVLRKEVSLECVAKGYPDVVTQWFRLDNDSKFIKLEVVIYINEKIS